MTDTGSVAAINTPNTTALPQSVVHADRRDRGGQRHADSRQKSNHWQILLELSPGNVKCRFEYQRRQENGKDQLLRKLPFDENVEEVQPHAGEDQANGIGHAQTTTQHRDERGDEKQKAELRDI